MRVVCDAGAPGAKSYGFVELTPECEYMLVTEFLEDAVELGDAVVDDASGGLIALERAACRSARRLTAR
jgi:hypothetical protein